MVEPIYLDFSKALNAVPHGKLFIMLEKVRFNTRTVKGGLKER